MRRRAKIITAASLLLVIGYLVTAAALVPKSCFTSPDGKVSRSDWASHVARFDFQECDPFTGLRSNLLIGELSIAYGFESSAAPDMIELVIEPNGIARIARGLGSEDYTAISLTRADYLYFRNRLAPLRGYSETQIRDQPGLGLFDGDSRPKILCDSSFSLRPNGLSIVWDLSVEGESGTASHESILSSFDLGCEGPAGAALRARVEPLIDRLFALDRKWGDHP